MTYQLFDSVEALIAPETLAMLAKQPVSDVRCTPMAGGLSGSRLSTIDATGQEAKGQKRHRFILKRMSSRFDWQMQTTDDVRCRAVMLWQYGLLDRLPPIVDHTILACARDGDGWALLMRDIGAWLMPAQPWPGDMVRALLDALSAIHATFWDAPDLVDPALGLCDSTVMIQAFSPQRAVQFPSDTSPMPQMIREGWEISRDRHDPDVARALDELLADPQPLVRALSRYPATLVHGSYRDANLGLKREPIPCAYVLDWQLATRTVATMDVVWFLTKVTGSLGIEAGVLFYQQCLARRLGERFDLAQWQPMWDLSMLADILRMCPFRAWGSVHQKDKAQRAADRRMLEAHNGLVREALGGYDWWPPTSTQITHSIRSTADLLHSKSRIAAHNRLGILRGQQLPNDQRQRLSPWQWPGRDPQLAAC